MNVSSGNTQIEKSQYLFLYATETSKDKITSYKGQYGKELASDHLSIKAKAILNPDQVEKQPLSLLDRVLYVPIEFYDTNDSELNVKVGYFSRIDLTRKYGLPFLKQIFSPKKVVQQKESSVLFEKSFNKLEGNQEKLNAVSEVWSRFKYATKYSLNHSLDFYAKLSVKAEHILQPLVSLQETASKGSYPLKERVAIKVTTVAFKVGIFAMNLATLLLRKNKTVSKKAQAIFDKGFDFVIRQQDKKIWKEKKPFNKIKSDSNDE